MNRAFGGNSTNCAADLAAAFELIGQQQLGEPISVTSERNSQVEKLGQSCLENAQNPNFCQAHCLPSTCPAHTGETVVKLNHDLLKSGCTTGKEQVMAKLEVAANLIEEQSTSQCPFLQDPDLFTPIAKDLARGVDPEVLADLGIGSEESPLGGTLATDIDPDEVLAHS